MDKRTNDEEYDSLSSKKDRNKKNRKDQNRAKRILSNIYRGDIDDLELDELEELDNKI